MPLSIRVFHAIIWKLFLIEFYVTGTEYGHVFQSKYMFTFAARRMQVRMNAKIFAHGEAVRKAMHKGKQPPKDDNINTLLFPFVTIAGRTYKWNKYWVDTCRELKIPIKDEG